MISILKTLHTTWPWRMRLSWPGYPSSSRRSGSWRRSWPCWSSPGGRWLRSWCQRLNWSSSIAWTPELSAALTGGQHIYHYQVSSYPIIFFHNDRSTPSTPSSDKVKTFVDKLDKFVNLETQKESMHKKEVSNMQKMLEETLLKNMHLQQDLENMSQELVRLSKLAVGGDGGENKAIQSWGASILMK